MRRLLDLRIVRWELKTLYIVVAWIVGFVDRRRCSAPLGCADRRGRVGESPSRRSCRSPSRCAIFRGRDEPVEPPRAWWRMTAWPTLSRRLGILFAVLTAVGVVGVALARWRAFAARLPTAARRCGGLSEFDVCSSAVLAFAVPQLGDPDVAARHHREPERLRFTGGMNVVAGFACRRAPRHAVLRPGRGAASLGSCPWPMTR